MTEEEMREMRPLGISCKQGASMNQRTWVKVHTFRSVSHADVESIVNSVLRAGGELVAIDLHPSGELILTIQYNKEEWDKILKAQRYQLDKIPQL